MLPAIHTYPREVVRNAAFRFLLLHYPHIVVGGLLIGLLCGLVGKLAWLVRPAAIPLRSMLQRVTGGVTLNQWFKKWYTPRRDFQVAAYVLTECNQAETAGIVQVQLDTYALAVLWPQLKRLHRPKA